MRKLTGSLGIALVSAGTALGLALTSATPAVATNQALMLNGIGLDLGDNGGLLPDPIMATVLGGMFGGSSYNRTAVPWPMQANPVTGTDSMYLTESVAVGADNLDAAIQEALTKIGPGEHVTVVGLSAGALVADEELKKLLADPNAPDKSKLNFVVYADSSRSSFNKNRYDAQLSYQYRPPVATKYDTVAAVVEYDGFADFPDRIWNLVAVVNAFAGEITNHVPGVFTDLSTVPASNITVTTNSLGGVTTNYLIPSKNLPLVVLLPFLAPHEAQLREIVNSAYKRNDATSTAATPAAAATVANSVESAPAPVAPVLADTAPAVSAPVAPVSNKPAEPAVDQNVVSESPVKVVSESPVKLSSTVSADTGEAPQQNAPRTPTARAVTGGHRSSPAPSRASAAGSRTAK